MGSAIAEQIKSKYGVWVFDKDRTKTVNASDVKVAKDIVDLIGKVDVVILAVKPQDFDTVLRQIKDYTRDKLVISIAAGIPTDYIARRLGCFQRIVRAMPNIGAKIGKSVTCICRGKSTGEEDLVFAGELFKNIGEVQGLPEDMMNAATAVSGSGPGYYFYLAGSNAKKYKKDKDKFNKDFIAELTKAAQGVGFDHGAAQYISVGTGAACEIVLEKSGLSPEELVKQVASKKGTTEAGLKKLKQKKSLTDAVKAALRRASELSK